MKPIRFLLSLGLMIPALGVCAAEISTPEQAFEVAFGGTLTQETPPPPAEIAQSLAQRATLIQKYTQELQVRNPGLSESAMYRAASSMADSEISSATPIGMLVTEKVPGAVCSCATKGYEGQDECPSTLAVSERLYSCSVSKGMTSFQNIIRDITKWFIYITMLLGVLALVGSGILWAWGSESEEYTKKAKGWAVNIIIGLALLFTFRYILGFLAPWIFQ